MSTKRPSRRRNETLSFRVGEHNVHMTIGFYPDGRPMEVFIDLHKEGSSVRGLMNALAAMISKAWQHGAPLADTLDTLVGTKFQPGGRGADHPAIEGSYCGSLLDGVGRVLAHELAPKVKPEPGVRTGVVDGTLWANEYARFEDMTGGGTRVVLAEFRKDGDPDVGIVRPRVLEPGTVARLENGEVEFHAAGKGPQ